MVIIDTAGRLAVDEVMMTEVANVKAAVNPQEILFVVDSMTGQDAVNTAKAFNDRLDFSGVVLTKLDGDTRGGAALSIKYTVDKPIKFTSSGEKMDTLDVFYPDRMAPFENFGIGQPRIGHVTVNRARARPIRGGSGAAAEGLVIFSARPGEGEVVHAPLGIGHHA